MKPLQFLFLLTAVVTLSDAMAQKKSGGTKQSSKSTPAQITAHDVPLPLDQSDVPLPDTKPTANVELPSLTDEMIPAPPSKKVIPPPVPDMVLSALEKGNKKVESALEKVKSDLEKARAGEQKGREQVWAELRKKNSETQKALLQLVKTYNSLCSRDPNRELPSLVLLAGEIPEPELPALAKKIDLNNPNNPYDKYIAKIEEWQKRVSDKTKAYSSIIQKGPEQAQKEAQQHADKMRNEVNNNPLIAEMGGMEKVKAMTPAEREKAAREAARKNPNMMMPGQNDPGMQAFMQKMMTDPAFAAQYNKMSNQDKMAAYQNFVKEQTGEATLVKRDDKAFEASMADRNKTNKFLEVEKLLALTLQRSLQLHELVNKQSETTNQHYDALAKEMKDRFDALYDALPLQSFGEAGHMKSTGALDKAKALEYYMNGMDAAAAYNHIFRNSKVAMQYSIAVFDGCIDTYWGKGKAPEIHGVDAVARVGDAIFGFLESCKQKAEAAKRITASNAGVQCGLETALYGQCQK
jgi:hypothetical protein